MSNQTAFPNDWRQMPTGMTLRDYFAAKAIQRTLDYGTPFSESAELAYRVADAMLKARSEGI